MGKTKLGLKEPFSCLNSKYHTWAIQINHLFSLFQPQTAKKLWIECQKHENVGYFWNKVCSHNTVDTDLFKTFTENTKQKEVTEAPFSLLLPVLKRLETVTWFSLHIQQPSIPIVKRNAMQLLMVKSFIHLRKSMKVKKGCSI